jgi:hypothetical protein
MIIGSNWADGSKLSLVYLLCSYGTHCSSSGHNKTHDSYWKYWIVLKWMKRLRVDEWSTSVSVSSMCNCSCQYFVFVIDYLWYHTISNSCCQFCYHVSPFIHHSICWNEWSCSQTQYSMIILFLLIHKHENNAIFWIEVSSRRSRVRNIIEKEFTVTIVTSPDIMFWITCCNLKMSLIHSWTVDKSMD